MGPPRVPKGENMFKLRRLFFVKTIFLLVILTFILNNGVIYAGRGGPTVLARVEIEGMVDGLKLPVYAHLQDGDGNDYALVIAGRKELKSAGVKYHILDKNAKGANYFLLTMFPRNTRVPTRQLKKVLLDDGRQAVIRASFQETQALTELDIDVQWLGDSPMVLGKKQRQILSPLEMAYDPTVSQMINQVSQTTVETYARNITGEDPVNIGGSNYTIVSRNTNSGTPIEKATQYVYEFMQGNGLDVSYHNWSVYGNSGRNVIGEKLGVTQPGEIVLIMAHLDCMPSGSVSYGADDNGSGSVGVMVCAEILSQYQFNRTLRFCFFTGEEQGLLGSGEYADMIYGNGDDVVAVYNMDMLGYDGSGGPDLRLHTRTTSSSGYTGDLAIANTFIDVVDTYSLDSVLNPIIDADGITASDHSPFWSNGYPAILGIEEHDGDMSPYYHTTSDRVSTLNMTYFANFIRASVGTAAHLAIPGSGIQAANFSATPTSGGYPLTVQFTDLTTGGPVSWSWDFGDSGTSTQQNPVYTYNSAGIYTVSLTATYSSGSDTETKNNYITVTAPQPPIAEFTADNTTPTTGQVVSFTDQSTNSPTSWSWTFTGGTPSGSTQQNPTVTYNGAGTFQVSLTVTNAAGSDTETKAGYIVVSETPLEYCDSQGNNYNYEYIGNVTVGDLNNSSGGSNYTDFTGQTALLTAGGNVGVSLTPVFPSSTYTEYWKIWIDYNIDGDFDDAGEEVFSSSGSSTVTGNFDVSAAASGTTRMRVSMKWDATPSSCEAFSYGEVEDYTVTFGTAPLAAEFSADAVNINAGQIVTFTDTSTGGPTAWSWTFPGGNPASGNLQNPSVTYNVVGTYNVSLTVTRGGDSDSMTKNGYIAVTDTPPDYCDSQGNNYSYEYIGNVTVGNLDHTSSGSNYSDFTGQTAALAPGNTVNVSLVPVFPSSTYNEYWKIWIDYNRDGDFEDAGEEVFSGSGSSTVTGSFDVPVSASGATRMRVSMKWNGAPSPCETFSYGEVEDYTVTFSASAAPERAPTNDGKREHRKIEVKPILFREVR